MHLMESLKDRDSVGYEIIRYVIEQIENDDNKELQMDNLKFTSKTLKYIFGDNFKSEDYKLSIITDIKEMISIGWIEVNKKSMILTEKMINHFYNIS